MSRKQVDVAVIIPDASPILTLARVDRLNLFDTFAVPITLVDQVHYEVTKPANDPDRRVAGWLRRMGNKVNVAETMVGLGFRTKLESGQRPPSRNLGEIALDEYATELALAASPTFVPLVLFEDPDVLQTRIARLRRVHLLTTSAWIGALADEGIINDGETLLDEINAQRKSPLMPIDYPGQTKRVRSNWLRRKT